MPKEYRRLDFDGHVSVNYQIHKVLNPKPPGQFEVQKKWLKSSKGYDYFSNYFHVIIECAGYYKGQRIYMYNNVDQRYHTMNRHFAPESEQES